VRAYEERLLLSNRMKVVQVERKDWFNVAKGIMSLDFWRAQLTTHPSYSWYLQRVRTTVQRALATSNASQVVLVGHSAGGWLARAFVGAEPHHFTSSI
jgi:pimeloyl-ACP methyl ester carboxylesterase